jgi:hypothetical protein
MGNKDKDEEGRKGLMPYVPTGLDKLRLIPPMPLPEKWQDAWAKHDAWAKETISPSQQINAQDFRDAVDFIANNSTPNLYSGLMIPKGRLGKSISFTEYNRYVSEQLRNAAKESAEEIDRQMMNTINSNSVLEPFSLNTIIHTLNDNIGRIIQVYSDGLDYFDYARQEMAYIGRDAATKYWLQLGDKVIIYDKRLTVLSFSRIAESIAGTMEEFYIVNFEEGEAMLLKGVIENGTVE